MFNFIRYLELPKKFFRIISNKQKRKFPLVLLTIIIGILTEGLFVYLVFPLFQSLKTKDYGILNNIANVLGLENLASESRLNIIIFLSLVILAMFIFKNLIYLFSKIYYLKYSFEIKNYISLTLFKKYMYQELSNYKKKNSSIYLRNLLDIVETLGAGFVHNMFAFLSEILVVIAISIVLINNTFSESIFLITATIFISILYIYITKNLSQDWSKKRLHHDDLKIKSIKEGLGAFKELKLLKKEYLFVDNFNKNNVASNYLNFKFNILQLLPRVYLEIVGSILILLYIFYFVKDKSFIEIAPTLALVFAACFRLLPSFNRILGSIEAFRFGLPALDTVYDDLISTNVKIDENKNLEKSTISFKKNIYFKNLSFSYDDKIIFEKINLDIKKNSLIGIIGKSGSGKTTFVNLICGLLTPKSGMIYSDERNIHLNIDEWQNKISYVHQSTFLIEDTLKKNITFQDNLSEKDQKFLNEIINDVQLKDLVNNLDNGLNSIIFENGSNLSLGQIQRIGVARALYFNKEVLICDEITSSLDTINEKKILECIMKLKNKTIIIISHKANIQEFCEKLYEVTDTNIKEIKSL